MTLSLKLRFFTYVIFAALVVAAAPIAHAAFPDRQIRLIVPYPPGGPTDAIARIISQYLSQNLGQTIIVDNRGGANGNVGMQLAANSAADGYTLFFATTGTMAINPSLYRKMTLNPAKAFVAVGSVALSWNVLVVLPSFPANNLKELIALAKQEPGVLTYGSAGNGSPSHLAVELLKSMAGINMTHVPYRGSAPAIIDLLGGRISMMFDSVVSQVENIKSGKVKALVQSATVRSPALPTVPTVAEAGLPGYEVTNFFGIVAPAGTPSEVTARLHTEIERVLAREDVKERLANFGATPLSKTQQAFTQLINDEIVKWSKLVKESGASID